MSETVGSAVELVVLDKDGTLVDFDLTWAQSVGRVLAEIDDEQKRTEVGRLLGYQFGPGVIAPGSPFMAETAEETVARLEPVIDGASFIESLNRTAAELLAPAVGAQVALDGLVSRGVTLAVVTNDEEANTLHQLGELGWLPFFVAIVGGDSGYRPKPSGQGIGAVADQVGVRRSQVMMVGDTQHDIDAALDAGVIAVLVGRDPEGAQHYHHHISRIDELLGLAGLAT